MEKIKNLILTITVSVLTLLSVALLWEYNFLLTLVLIILAILMLLITKSKKEIKIFLFCGFAGAFAEIFAIYFGAWSYANPVFLGIPIWLIILWGIASIFTNRVALFFKD